VIHMILGAAALGVEPAGVYVSLTASTKRHKRAGASEAMKHLLCAPAVENLEKNGIDKGNKNRKIQA
jgi:hypothetical protein